MRFIPEGPDLNVLCGINGLGDIRQKKGYFRGGAGF